jgi:hypothetical protein
LLSNWKDGDPSMTALAEVIASSFAGAAISGEGRSIALHRTSEVEKS